MPTLVSLRDAHGRVTQMQMNFIEGEDFTAFAVAA